ncbi:MAG: hypothetical protein IKB71_01045 [Lentisphaeria bacterium]|nr:hypothetical protein [Lentisphaeria bacterium]
MLNKNKVLGSAFLLGVCSTALIAVETPSQKVIAKELPAGIRQSVNRHTVGYLKKENDAAEIVKKANELFKNENYIEARNLYINAKRRFNALNPEYFRDRIQFCNNQINLCYYEIANQALKKADESAAVKDYDEAIRLCQAAAEAYPECKPVMEKKIARYTAIRQTVSLQKDTSTAMLLPNKELDEYEISVNLRRARALVNAGLYEKAKRVYEDILKKNPYRSDVLQDLRAVNNYIRKNGVRRSINSRRAAVTANELEWALPLPRRVEKNVEALVKPIAKAAVEESPLVNKIKAIRIPRFEFEDMKLRTVLQTLRELSARNDPSGIGVNIFLRQNLGSAAAADGASAEVKQQPQQEQQPAAKQDDENANNNADAEDKETDEEDVSDEEDESNWTELEKITLSLPPMINQTLEQIIRNICANAKLRYRVEKYAIVIEETDMPETDMITKIFPVDGTALSDAGDPSNPDDLKNYFSGQGISFPEGAKIVYDAKISRIFATNTLENLNKLEAVCEESLSSNQPMVQIQLRIIEISQTDLNALGFNYTLTDNSTKNDPAFESINTKNQLRGPAAESASGPQVQAGFNMGEFSLGVDIKALNDLTSKDVLASPRVTTLPDEPVEIKLVTQTYFVEDFDDPETEKTTAENGDINYTYVGPFPNFEGEPQELGIKFRTTPSIDMNNSLINMKLDPEISSLVGWTTYYGTDEDGMETSVRTPKIAKRSISTNVTVRDGETLVLGGVIEDNVTQRKDKVPLLGDIPLLGRLFQSRSRQSVKKNLLIFVTPRLVRPDGTFWKPENHASNRGVARFL